VTAVGTLVVKGDDDGGQVVIQVDDGLQIRYRRQDRIVPEIDEVLRIFTRDWLGAGADVRGLIVYRRELDDAGKERGPALPCVIFYEPDRRELDVERSGPEILRADGQAILSLNIGDDEP
jgi:hypothetical protein